jgi:hypothetical protein
VSYSHQGHARGKGGIGKIAKEQAYSSYTCSANAALSLLSELKSLIVQSVFTEEPKLIKKIDVPALLYRQFLQGVVGEKGARR